MEMILNISTTYFRVSRSLVQQVNYYTHTYARAYDALLRILVTLTALYPERSFYCSRDVNEKNFMKKNI